jgi:ABC-type phosphate transport system ATPase subunit
VIRDSVHGSDVFAFEQVSVTFGTTVVLDRIDLRIPSSGITVVSGPSGSGKSTLTRLCNRLLDASQGVVRHRGQDVMELDVLALRRHVGMVFQRPTLFDGSVRHNLAATGVQDPELHAAVLDSVGLGPVFLERAANTLSGGESQRVCLARTLLMRPEALVADEPTASLDEDSARTLEELARGLSRDGVPILWVTHDPAQADRIADHRVTLDQGRVSRSHMASGPA